MPVQQQNTAEKERLFLLPIFNFFFFIFKFFPSLRNVPFFLFPLFLWLGAVVLWPGLLPTSTLVFMAGFVAAAPRCRLSRN